MPQSKRPENRSPESPDMPKVHHMVVVKFKDGVEGAVIDDVFRRLGELPGEIPGISSYAAGPYSSREGLNAGFTHGFLMTFESPQARDAYLIHPEHERVKERILPFVQDVVAFDFEAP